MAPNEDEDRGPVVDRRLRTTVDNLAQRVHDIELAHATQKGELSTVKGQVDTLIRTTATAADVKAASALSTAEVKGASDLLTNKIDTLSKEVSGIKSYIAAFAGAVLLAVLAAVLAGVFKTP